MARRWIFMLLPCTPALSLSNKVDAASAEVLRYAYDATGLLTNRWTKAKGTTTYRYDALGQLTNVVYPVSPALTLQYDLLGRLTNLVDGFGQTRYSYANNRLASEDGPWAEDTVSYSYQYAGPRSGLTLLQPNASPWTQSYGYDAAERLTSVVSPAGSFGYTYDSTRVALPGTLTLPSGATIATSYDFMARLTNTTLRSSQQAVLNHHSYGYNAASQRTSVTNLAGNTVAYTYDRSGQLTQASGKEANGTTRLNEQFGYGYDDENQLITVIVTNGVNNSTLSRFAYDGFGRRRVRTECVWQNGGWATNALVRYVYDGMVVLQERDGNNLPTVTYTRGRDLSSSLQGAGGIGGLLALTLHSSLPTPHFFYHADGNGNVTCLINEKQAVVARYVYEPFGNVLSMSGSLADLNLYRFSSKEAHPVTGLVYYGFRFYDPNLQRWVNRDPVAETGGFNLYGFVGNNPLALNDPLGLRKYYWDGHQLLIIYPAWWQFWKRQPDVYYVHPALAQKLLRDAGIEDAAIATAAALAALEAQKHLLDEQQRRQTPPTNCPKPPGWNDQWTWGPSTARKSGDNWRWFDPQGGEWRYQEDPHHDPHWDYNPWRHPSDKWRNVDADGQMVWPFKNHK